MSNLRIFGIMIGLMGIVVTFLWYRGPKWKRSNFILLMMLNISIFVVSLNPNAVNFVRDILSLKEYQYGRLFALLILSNMFLLFFTFYSRSKQNLILQQLDNLVRGLSARELKTEFEQVRKQIKPIMILIPAFNEADNLSELLPKIPNKIADSELGVLVVDDGSEDQTKNVVLNAGRLVVSNVINRGGGAALRLGYDIIKEAGGKICVTMDADGQHRPEDIAGLVQPVLNGEYDFVIGSRILGGQEKDSRLRSAGVAIFGRLISFLLGKKITDPSSGFRAFKIDIIEPVQLYEDQYHTSELIIEAVRKNMRIGEVPITILKRRHGVSKKGKNWIYGFRFAKTILKTWWRS